MPQYAFLPLAGRLLLALLLLLIPMPFTPFVPFADISLTQPALAEDVKVKYKADKVEYLNQEGLYRLIGNVDLEVRDMRIKTEKLDYDTRNKILRSDVPFEIVQTPKDPKEGGPRTLRGKSFAYNVDLKRIEAQEVYLVIPAQQQGQEVYIQGDWMTAYDDGLRVVFGNGFFTTCNHFEGQLEHADEDPYSRDSVRRRATHYAIEAEVLDYVRGDRVLAWNAEVLTYENKAFWFPFWYAPLFGPPGFSKPDVDAGQNPVEGVFARFKGYYRWNDYHDGYWYLTAMEKKGVGVGFQHDWIAFPNSITRFYFYGIPVTEDLIGLPGAIFSMPNLAEDLQEQGLTTQQIEAGNSRNFLDSISQYLSDKFEDREFEIRHRQLLTPHMEADIVYTDKDMYNLSLYQAARNPQRNFSFNLRDTEIFNVDAYSDLTLDTTLQLTQGINSPQTRAFINNVVTETTQITQSQNRTGSITATLGQTNLSVRSNWSDSFNQTVTRQLTAPSASPSASASPGTAPQQQNQLPSTGNENWNTTLDFRAPIDEKTNLTANIVYNSITSGGAPGTGSLQQTLQPRVDLSQTHDWGSLALNYTDFFDLSPVANPNQNTGQIKKLPEMVMRFNPFFQDSFPLQLESTIGRYFDPASFRPASDLNEIGRSIIRLSLPAKDFDLGLGNKVNFGNTRFEQRFYQTLDAEYIFRAQVALRNELTKYFIPNFTYQRGVQDFENNSSPFTNFEPLAFENINRLDMDLRIGNIPEFTMSVAGGYDYLNRVYSPIRANITSEIGGRFALRFSTGYNFKNITDLEVGKPLEDEARNIYRHGPCQAAPCIVTTDQVGSLNLYGGRWDLTTLGMRWRSTDYELNIGNLNTFGLEEGIPEGFELGGDISYDFHQGRINGLNGVLRWKLGSSWQWHTEIELTASIQPVTVAGRDLVQLWQALEIPFNIKVRKDLHDFILTASWDSFNQQFNLNLSLLAFPFSTDQLLGNVGNLGQQLNQLSPTGQGF